MVHEYTSNYQLSPENTTCNIYQNLTLSTKYYRCVSLLWPVCYFALKNLIVILSKTTNDETCI